MKADADQLVLIATRPGGQVARMVAARGVHVLAAPDDEAPADRYILSTRVAVERRTAASFLLGITDKTLFTSAIALRESYQLPVLVVEGNVDYERRGFSPQAARGALTSMLLQYGVSVLATPTAEETVELLVMMARQEQLGIPDISLIPKRKAADLPDLQRRVVEMLPGCGMAGARLLLQRFGSVQRIAGATADELRALPGIGSKRAAEIDRVLHAEYESVDTEKDLEDAIEAEPGLLFDRPVEMLARQHRLYAEAGEPRIADLVFRDPAANEVILVELKRGAIAPAHHDQLRGYLSHASRCALLCAHVESGAALRGLLATVTPGNYTPDDPQVSVRIVDRHRAARVLRGLWERRREGPAR